MLQMKVFSETDIAYKTETYDSLSSVSREDLVYDPPEWMKAGLMESATGYGRRLNTGLKINWNGKLFRVYCTIFSNVGTCWFKTKGRKIGRGDFG